MVRRNKRREQAADEFEDVRGDLGHDTSGFTGDAGFSSNNFHTDDDDDDVWHEVGSQPEPEHDEVRAKSTLRPPKACSKKKQQQKRRAKSRDSHSSLSQSASDSALDLTSLREAMPASNPLPLFIASIGNPGTAYANTLHSAGHTVIARLAAHLGYPPFAKDKELAKGLSSRPPTLTSNDHGDWTLWQCPSYMNESGKSVRAAYMAWSKSLPLADDGGIGGRLVILHDELEKPLGNVTLKTAAGASAKGHNGLKSIMGVMGNTAFARVGVGIGRPVSRESDEVARYVLRKMTGEETVAVEGSVKAVVSQLKVIEKG